MNFIDKSGREIKTGDYIIYGHLLGRCAGLKYGKILKLKLGEKRYNTQELKILVQGVEYQLGYREPYLSGKGTLKFSDRILKIEHNQMPPEVLALLKNIEIINE